MGTLEWYYLVRCDKFIALYNVIALKCAFSLSHLHCVRFECDKLHFIALKAHFTFIVGISIYQKRCTIILGGSPDIQSFTITIGYRTILARAAPLRCDSEPLLFLPLWR